MKERPATMKWSFRYMIGILLALALALAGCGNSSKGGQTPTGNDSKPAAQEPAKERVVEHAMGKTKVPVNPQRVVVLDTGELDIVLALGVKPVGAVIAPEENDFPAYLKDKTQGVQKVGTIAQPNLETIAALKPDLILTNTLRHEKIYDKLSQIAPTVVGERPNWWKNNLKLYAQALGKEQEAEKLMADYQKRLDEFKQKMGDRLSKTQVSLLRSFPDHARIYQNDSFAGQVLKDAGLPRPKSQDKAAVFEKVTEERIPDMDGDVILMFYYGKSKGDSLAKIKSNPLWAQLNAVKQGKVYEVDDGIWGLGLGPIAANLIVDDLFKYLTK
jgi:iron complex transport system substrate-binding protein